MAVIMPLIERTVSVLVAHKQHKAGQAGQGTLHSVPQAVVWIARVSLLTACRSCVYPACQCCSYSQLKCLPSGSWHIRCYSNLMQHKWSSLLYHSFEASPDGMQARGIANQLMLCICFTVGQEVLVYQGCRGRHQQTACFRNLNNRLQHVFHC